MNLSVPLQANSEVKKKLFKLKPLRRDGLMLNIHYSKSNAKIRFFHCCFHENGNILASADNDGDIYIVDFFFCKFWSLPKLASCTFIQFSSFNQSDILTGNQNGDIYVIDFDSGQVSGKLEGHKLPVSSISFAQKIYCLTASQYEAIIWDLQTNTKLQVLSLDKNCILKYVGFIPISNNILACFKDDLIQIWNHDKFESIKQFFPITWNNFSVKTVIFSRNGQVMIVAGYLPTLAIFLLDKWKLAKLVTLPEYVHTIKSVQFIAQPFDGGCNKILAILSGQGIVYFYDIEQNIILSELTPNCQIKKIECSPNGTYIACVTCGGEVELYNLNQYVMPPADVKVEKAKKVGGKIKLKECKEKVEAVKNEINDMLDTEKLKAILKEFGEYPEVHRLKIWEKLLKLPNNVQQYNSVINHTTIVAFKDLYARYPLENQTSIKCLKKLLNNIVTWCPFFANVEYLPVFAFPFAKVFQNKPVACFEALCTIILNWSQHWFEYYPLAPVNILAMIENVFMEHDPELLHHFSCQNITSNLYAWPLLETAFSEVLTAREWLQFWDHVLTSEPSFLLCAVVSYNILHRDILLSLKTTSNVEFFFHNQNPNSTRKFLQKTYHILNHTSEKMHPRQYLEKFNSIEIGNYPLFVEYPKTTVDVEMEQMKRVNNQLVNMETYEANLMQQVKKKWEACECEKMIEEKKRKEEMKQICLDKLKSEVEKVKTKRDELHYLKKMLGDAEQKIFSETRKTLPRGDQKLLPPCGQCWTNLQDDYIKRYAKLLKYKFRIQEFVDLDDISISSTDMQQLKKYKRKLDHEIDKVKQSLMSPDKVKQLNLATNIVAVDNLIKNVEKQLELDSDSSRKANVDSRLQLLQKETKDLEEGVSKLLNTLRKSKRFRKSSRESRKESRLSDHKEDKSSSDGYQKTVRFSETS
ncbi:TBC1 domain family member 31 [Anoplophora glabripennis]|uniref:TBC1 domain family member 31 n=1 Tax=Anoplophora glabripennis TaxID=217634 RepID=UPI0008744B6D|nr:TBC1 domain family member 31 [Anoplophora glabripennis]